MVIEGTRILYRELDGKVLVSVIEMMFVSDSVQEYDSELTLHEVEVKDNEENSLGKMMLIKSPDLIELSVKIEK